MSSLLNSLKNIAVNPMGLDEAQDGRAYNGQDVINSSRSMGMPASDSDFEQWIHAMKMVAQLQGGMPPDFRRKLWLALSEKYIQSRNVDWLQEETKCLSETWGSDDQELGAQIVKDLHRTGSSLCSGPTGSINQAKLKQVLLGYARWNPEVGYCQGFNMLGALILQVMDKNESDTIKVMIFLIEGVLPTGYFHGGLCGLQADMAVFRELLAEKLPILAKHLERLQGPLENALEPPLTNVFTMQWFLTLFCNCLPINCVLRVWDLVLLEGSDILLRCALVIWAFLQEKVLRINSVDDFYSKMGEFSSQLLNGTLFDSNGLVQRIVAIGPIHNLGILRERHCQNLIAINNRKGLKVLYNDDDIASEEESRLAVATAWSGIRGSRRSSQPNVVAQNNNNVDNKERIALDINVLKKQYNKLRERQKQAHVIISNACVRPSNPTPTSSRQISNLLSGKPALTSSYRRFGAPPSTIPPQRVQSKPIRILPKTPKKAESYLVQNIKREEGGHIRVKDPTNRRYESSESDSSTSTSLCDDEGMLSSSFEASPLTKDKIEVPHSYFAATEEETPKTENNELGAEAATASDAMDLFEATDNNFSLTPYEILIDDTTHIAAPGESLEHQLVDRSPSPKPSSISDQQKYFEPTNHSSPQSTIVEPPDLIKPSAEATDSVFQVTENGVTNKVFEHVNSSELHIPTVLQPSDPAFALNETASAPALSPTIINQSPTDQTSSIPNRRNSEQALALMEENSKILNNINNKHAKQDVTSSKLPTIQPSSSEDIKNPTDTVVIEIPNIVKPKKQVQFRDVDSEIVSHEPSKIIKEAQNVMEKNNVLARGSTEKSYINVEEVDIHISPTSSVVQETILHITNQKNIKNESYFFGTLDEIAKEQESRSQHKKITKIDIDEPSQQFKNELKELEKVYEKEDMAAHKLSKCSETFTYCFEIPERNSRCLTYYSEMPEQNSRSRLRDLEAKRERRKTISTTDYDFRSFEEITREIRREIEDIKREINLDTKISERQKPYMPAKNEDIGVEHLKTDTLKSLLNETKNDVYNKHELDMQKYCGTKSRIGSIENRGFSYNSQEQGLLKSPTNQSSRSALSPNCINCSRQTMSASADRDISEETAVLSPRGELRAILSSPSLVADLSYFDGIREPTPSGNTDLLLFSRYDQVKTPTLRNSTNINEKLNSISSTIKSINSLCRGETKYESTYKALERMYGSKDAHTSSFKKETDLTSVDHLLDGLENKKDCSNSDFLKSIERQTLNTKIYPDDLKIRHTTVTSTLYDRVLSQKKAQSSRLDKSPSSPVITKAYLDSLRPTPTARVIKSAETSPSRYSSSSRYDPCDYRNLIYESSFKSCKDISSLFDKS